MKSNRILWLVLAGIIIIVLAGAGIIYAADSREVNKREELNDSIAKNQATLTQGLAAKEAKKAEAIELEQRLAEARQLLEETNFRDSAESIEYDRILFSIANSSRLQITGLNATSPLDMKETAVTYQVTTFTVTVEGITPTAIFSSGLDSTKYIDDVVGNILDFVHAVATSADFDTAMIQSISILPPEPMTDEEVGQLIEAIKNQIESKLTDTEKEGKTDEQIAAMVQGKLAAMSSSEIQWLMEEAGVDKVTATITIKIWTYKGA